MSNEQKVTRKLRAILSTDVKGYSILMADDEVFTIKMIKEYANRIAKPGPFSGAEGLPC